MNTIGWILQIFGMLSVTLCLISGMVKGDYGKIELVQFLAGSLFFYGGNMMRSNTK